METNKLNQFPIRNYLAGLGIQLVKDRNYYGMYHSLFREDNNASMKVDFNKNLWIDYGTNDGGTLIDLVMKMENSSFNEAVSKLEKMYAYVHIGSNAGNLSDASSFHGKTDYPAKQESAIKILKIQPIVSPPLLDYLNERKINIEIAKLHCSEIHYDVGEKNYYAIGFKNDAGGYELRSKYFKGCTSKDITSVKMNGESCRLFEGFMDYLSFLTLKNWQYPKMEDTIILNSLSNLSKVKNSLSVYKNVATFLDNDDAGRRAIEELTSAYEVINQSGFYVGYKDLNDYLCRKPMMKLSLKKKNTGLKH
jgi:hypothetical protein